MLLWTSLIAQHLLLQLDLINVCISLNHGRPNYSVPNASTREEATTATGLIDNAAVETELFHWIIEDNFSCGRPDWDLAGAIFTKDVNKFEKNEASDAKWGTFDVSLRRVSLRI